MSPIDKDLISLVLLELLALVIIPYLSIRLKKSLKKRVEQRNKQMPGSSLNLAELEQKLDEALSKETAESLKEWLKSKRKS